jgi:phospholipid/cholesterol/gamma-HCH transport system substrate-binding protein
VSARSRGPRGAIAAVLAFALIVAGAAGIVLRDRPKTYALTAYFPRAIGLFPRSTVRVLGVEVGRVISVDPAGDRVRVTMRVRDDVKIPADASAIIVPISLISDRYVQLAPVYRGGPVLEHGAVIPLSRGVAPAELDDLLATLKRFLQALEPGSANAPGALGRLIQNADKALAGKGQQLGSTIDALATILDTLGRNASSVDATIVALDHLFTQLSRHDTALEATNRGLDTVFTALSQEQDALRNGTGDLAAAVSQLGQLVRAHRSDLEADLSTLASVSDVLYRQRNTLLEQIMWLPVLGKGVSGAYDATNHRLLVRDYLMPVKP